MSRTQHLAAGLVVVGIICLSVGALADRPPLDKLVGGVLVGDQDLDSIFLTRDMNGDGDADDDGEALVYYHDPNYATNNLSTIFQSDSGCIFYADVETKGVYRLCDLNGDCDAQDPGEFNLWFGLGNAGEFPVTVPNGVWETGGAVYVMNAGSTSTPADAIYRTVDLNADGDAQDTGEATLWMDVQNLVANSAAFELVFIGEVAYWADSLGGSPDAVMRAEDVSGNGVIEPGEFNVFIDEAGGYGVGIFSALATDGVSLYVIDSTGTPQVLFQLTDLNDSGTIDSSSEVVSVWDETHLPAGYELSGTFAIAIGPGGDFVITSNGSNDPGTTDNVFRLSDLNGDGDYFDDGETIVWVSGHGPDAFVDRARAVAFILARPGDMDGDGDVDLADLSALLATYGLCDGDAGYNAAADFDNDDCITLADLATLLARYGSTCP